jgi:O-antigen/teichoic acid export membrane protein
MTRKLFKDVSASAIQVIINQVLGISVFLLTSLYLPKDVYGELNWSYAVLMFITTVLSLRLEQIVVKRAAVDKDTSAIMTLYMIHVFLSGMGFYLLLLFLNYIFPSFFTVHYFLLILGISQLLAFFSSPFKNVANGKERFSYLAVMSSTAVLIRAIGLLIIIVYFHLTIQWVMAIFIASSFIELVICFYLVTNRMQIKLTTHIRFSDYVHLLKESLPQIGVAILMAGISRIDWILLGFFSTVSLTAEYSFAYRVYELSPFPLLIIAPILLSRFAKYFATNTEQLLLQKKNKLSLLVRSEMIVATLIPLILNIIWVPFIDSLTGNKYGAVNQSTFLILSCCIPFQYISNLLWSAHFAQNRLKLILRITLITFCVMLAGDLLFIPLYNVKGAALVYLAAIIIEYINYMRSSELSKIRETWQSLLICIIAAAGSGFAAFYIFDNVLFRLAFALPLFSLLLIATRQFRINDIAFVLQSLKKKKA